MTHNAPHREGRRILFIAYHFPPSAAVGGLRIAHFAAAVRSFAWHPRVLTIADRDIESIDRARLKDVEGIPVHKAGVRRSLVDVVQRLWVRRRWRRTTLAAVARPAHATGHSNTTSLDVFAGLRRFILSFLALPDWQRGWCMPATVHGLRMIRRDRTDWFMTSCPPYSVHLIGLALKAMTGRRWVADFRDPWMTTGWKRLYPTSKASMRIEAMLERLVVRSADLVVFNVERLRDAYRERYDSVPPDKFVYIPNGITLDARTIRPEKYDVFTISYTGSLYVGRSPEPVFKAIAQLLADGRVPTGAIRLKLVGQCRTIDGTSTETVVGRYGLESVVEVLDAVPYREAFEIVQRSHLALLLAPNLPYQIPAKVYDYLGAGTRIVAIAEDGATADLLNDTGAGVAFDAAQIDRIASFIEKAFASKDAAVDVRAALARYDVRRITQELITHMTRIESGAGATV